MESLYASSRPAGRKTRAKIAAACKVSARQWMRGGFKGRYFMITRDRVVFVMQAPETVVTVFKLEPGER